MHISNYLLLQVANDARNDAVWKPTPGWWLHVAELDGKKNIQKFQPAELILKNILEQ